MREFREDEHPRDEDGQFTDKGGYRQNTGYDEILTKSPTSGRGIELTPKEYRLVCQEIAKRYAGRDEIPQTDCVYTDTKFIVFVNDVASEQSKIIQALKVLDEEQLRIVCTMLLVKEPIQYKELLAYIESGDHTAQEIFEQAVEINLASEPQE